MAIVVQKFGGSSVADAAKMLACAEHVSAALRAGDQPVVVVSAMGEATDDLLALAKTIAAAPGARHDARELDQLLHTGELAAASLMALTLRGLGINARSLSGAQAGIRTDSQHGRATITAMDAGGLRSLIAAGCVPIVAGFQGVTDAGDVTTLGRGGSDTTAVALAAALGGPTGGRCVIYKDVDGVYTADPRVVPEARRLERVTYEEMLEAAALGSQVIHPRAVELARLHGTAVGVQHSHLAPGRTGAGTVIVAEDPDHARPVTSVVLKTGVGRVSIRGVQNRPGVQAAVFAPLSRAGVPIDDIIQEDDGPNTIGLTFTLARDDLESAHAAIQEAARAAAGQALRVDVGLSTVSAVGSGMRTASGVASALFAALAGEGVRIENITTSEIRISCVVTEADGPRAVRAIHQAFGLHAATEPPPPAPAVELKGARPRSAAHQGK